MKKNIVQDVIPPKRTIRNVELLYKTNRADKKNSVIDRPTLKEDGATAKSIPFSKPSEKPVDTSYKFEYEVPTRKSRKVLYVSLAVLLIAGAFGVSAFFKSAKITVTPKNEAVNLFENFKAIKNDTSGGLSFQIVSTTKDVERTVPATEEKMVEKKATGKIIVTNFNTVAQPLVKTTRFETPEGLIFRSLEDVVVPGATVNTKGETEANKIEVSVEADKAGPKYNISIKNFTLPGLKGTPKYTKILGISKTEMSGGFSGMQRTVSNETINSFEKELENELKTALSNEIGTQIPENYVLYPSSVTYTLDKATDSSVQSNDGTSNVVLKKKGSISAVIFDKGLLSRAIVSKIMPEATDDVIKITNLDTLNFSIASGTTFSANTSNLLDFSLSGQAQFVWVFDESKLKTELLGLSKKNAVTVIRTYKTIKEAEIETQPFWNQAIPNSSDNVTLINTIVE